MKKILNNCKKFNLVRKMLVVLLIFAMTFGTFAAVVSDNDSSAFVTKAELEALKTSYEKQVKNYYDKITEKVDNTIVAYLNYWNENGSGSETEPYPVGSIYVSADNTDPGTLFGGVWERYAKGRTLVGLDENNTYFNTVGKTGGAQTYKLTESNAPTHTHDFTGNTITTSEAGNHTHVYYSVINGDKFNKDGGSFYSVGQARQVASYNNGYTSVESWEHTHAVVTSAKVTINPYGNTNTTAINLINTYITVNIWKRIS